jgi:hypothetical protein
MLEFLVIGAQPGQLREYDKAENRGGFLARSIIRR